MSINMPGYIFQANVNSILVPVRVKFPIEVSALLLPLLCICCHVGLGS